MRGIGYTLSRLPAAGAFLTGAAILAGALTSAAHGQTSGSGNGTGTLILERTRPDEAAWATPRVSLTGLPTGAEGLSTVAAGSPTVVAGSSTVVAGSSTVALPQPLRPGDVALMRHIFALQAHGDIAGSAQLVSSLQDPMLLGMVLADRYLGRHYRSTVDELSDWLARYADQPEAPAIHALLQNRLRDSAARPPASETTPAVESTLPARIVEPDPVPQDVDPSPDDQRRGRLTRYWALRRNIVDQVGRGKPASALRLIATAHDIAPPYVAQLRAQVAQVLFTQNEDADALRVAQQALNDVAAADQPSLGFYIGGLAAWRLGRPDLARHLFEGGATALNTSASLHAASAFWASRASRSLHDAVSTVRWLRVAAEERLTFHGLLARRMLRMDTGIPPKEGPLSQADVDAVAATQRGWRVFALLQVGQSDRAEAELRGLWSNVGDDPVFRRSLLIVASATGLTDCAAQMAASMQSPDGEHHDELRFPIPRLRPAGGFTIDPALVYALTRLESNFDAEAISPAGARGLMQVMPATARYITGDLFYSADRLHEPAHNLAIGQHYIAYLAHQDGIDSDLLRVLASYNSGPGNFGRWGPVIQDQGDPLLFIEAIPVTETRVFVQHVLLYSWIYAARMHLPASSLDDLSADVVPHFAPPQFTPPRSKRPGPAAARFTQLRFTHPGGTQPGFTQMDPERKMALLSGQH